MLSCDLSTEEMEAGKSEVEGQPRLCSKSGVNLGYSRPCLKKKKLWQGLGFGFKQGEMGGKDRRDGEELPTSHP